ncbi:MAG: PilT/PilU family type 4a pilus ATPase [Acidobacteriota bacterium]
MNDPQLDALVRSVNQLGERADSQSDPQPEPQSEPQLEAQLEPQSGPPADPPRPEAAALEYGAEGAGERPAEGGQELRGTAPAATLASSMASAGPGLSSSALFQRPTVAVDGALGQHLRALVIAEASDLLLLHGQPPCLRIHGDLQRQQQAPLEPGEVLSLFDPYLSWEERETLARQGSLDFSLSWSAAESAPLRLRVNLHRQRGHLAASVRALPRDVPSLASLNLPTTIADLADLRGGLVLFCGPTGSGKSTTLAALLGLINRRRRCHIVTVEDPVEFEHPSREALVEHVEIGRDAPSFSAALRSVLRQDPDVLLVGEMRDLETVSAVLTAAETGHLVLSTLHAHDAARAVHRIVDAYPEGQQGQVRQQLAQGLSAIVMQQLIPTADGGGRVPAVEILRSTYAVRQLIRSQATEKLYTEITLGQRHGMVTMEASLAHWVRGGSVHYQEAVARSSRPEELEALLA